MINLISILNKYKEKKKAKLLETLLVDAKNYMNVTYQSAEHRLSSEGEYIFYQEAYEPDNDIFEDMEPTFSQMLFKFIKQQGISETECYKNANIDRKLFSKIRSDDEYQPKKTTVFALIIGLRLNLEDAETLLDCAGYSLSHSLKQDIIIEFAIKKQIYDMSILNEILFSLECQTLGSKE